MAVSKDKWNGYNGNAWMVSVYYTDWRGERRRHYKRGFKTKKAAQEYEREFLQKASRDIRIPFGDFIDRYMSDIKPQIKATTYANKEVIIDTHVRPYFKDRILSEISSADVLMWQNELLARRDGEGKGYSQTYLRSIQSQLSAIFNHAVKYYGLEKNPCILVKRMGKSKPKEMEFWTKEEYLRFSDAVKDKPTSYYAFQVLYWTGIRVGELLALTRADFDLEKRTLRITKNYQVVGGEAMITTPKTENSRRVIDLPKFLCDEMEDYFESIYRLDDDSRIFSFSKNHLRHEMERGCKKSGVKRIRVHDIRHSHVSLLIDMGFSALAIGKRVGHESTTITERYSHLFPSVQKDMAARLDEAFSSGTGQGE